MTEAEKQDIVFLISGYKGAVSEATIKYANSILSKNLDGSVYDVYAKVYEILSNDSVDDAVEKVEKQVKSVYGDAKKNISKKLKEFTKDFEQKDKKMFEKVQSGELSKEDYDNWKQGKVFIGDLWQTKLDQVTDILLNANEKAMSIINSDKMGVFATNANYTMLNIASQANIGINFTLYDATTIDMLTKDNPELLPRKVVNGKKDKAWNKSMVAKSIAQSIIIGENIDDTAKRIARNTSSTNMNAMVLYARTAMTGAQNAGRVESMQRAIGMGINVKKKWLATLDSKTRISHQKLDGQEQSVDKPFISMFGEIRYPGDPEAKACDVYNCRCTLINTYPEFNEDDLLDVRRDNESGEEIQNMDYEEWSGSKNIGKLDELNAAKLNYAKYAKKVANESGIDHVFKGIWKDDVTYKDWMSKKDSIQAKRDYYNSEIAKLNGLSYSSSSQVQDKIKQYEKYLKELARFEKYGQKAYEMLDGLEKAKQNIQDIYDQIGYDSNKKAVSNGPFGPDAYTDDRKKKAWKFSSSKEADAHLRPKTGEVWKNATASERSAIYDYTRSFHKFNEPLRGIEYGTSRYIGIGKTDLNAGSARNGKQLNAMTDIINKCTYDEDIWLRRGCGYGGMDKFFQCTQNLLQTGSQKDLERELLGKTVTEYGFMSCGSTSSSGFTDSINLRIYAPKGTKMMYVEPFSEYGHGSKKGWDGNETQYSFGRELETILQQGTEMRIVSITRKSGGGIDVELEVICQDNQQRWM